jgi:hypothetical protein
MYVCMYVCMYVLLKFGAHVHVLKDYMHMHMR